ncbi:hypothetical protein GCM10027355_18520 [Haloplanus salinarum]
MVAPRVAHVAGERPARLEPADVVGGEALPYVRRYLVVGFFDSMLETSLDDETAFDIGVALPQDGIARLRGLVDSACLGRCPAADGDAGRCVA